jgi:hypothetical protein
MGDSQELFLKQNLQESGRHAHFNVVFKFLHVGFRRAQLGTFGIDVVLHAQPVEEGDVGPHP